jgi:hypothetical protein
VFEPGELCEVAAGKQMRWCGHFAVVHTDDAG